jgi:hypothetical protein
MGTTCQKLSSEDETITEIFANLLLRYIPVNQSYAEFQQCMVNDELDYFKYFNYTNKIIGTNSYKDIQKAFFENLWKEIHKVQKIGLLVVLLSKSSENDKVDYILKHFDYYLKETNMSKERAVKLLINDTIYMSTTLSYSTFSCHVGNDNMKNYNQIWNDKRKEKLMYTIYQNYESVKYKYHQRKIVKDVNSFSSRGTSIDFEALILREFFELIETQLDGDFIREWLHDDFMKEKADNKICL